VRRRAVALGLAVGVIVAGPPGPTGARAQGQTAPAAGAQAPAAQTAPEARVFAAEAGLIFNPIKPGATQDFEMVLGRLRVALETSPNPTRREQAKGWKVFKAQEPFQGNVLYIFVVDPAVKGADYSVTRILAEAFPTEVQVLYEKFSGAFAGQQSLVNLSLVQAYGQVPGGLSEVAIRPEGR
jgi:hypothetical protein